MGGRFAFSAVVLAAASAAQGDLMTTGPETIQVGATAIYMAPGGRFILPGSARGGRDIDVEHLNIDSPRLSTGASVRLESALASAEISGVSYSTSDREASSPVARPIGDLDLQVGDPLRSSLNLAWVEGLLGYEFHEYRRGSAHGDVSLTVEAHVGARLTSIDMELEQIGVGEASASELFVEPLVGVGVRAELTRGYAARLRALGGWWDTGGSRSAQSWALELGFEKSWPTSVGRVVAQAGYRILNVDMDSGTGADRFEFRGSAAGLWAGVRVDF